MKALLILSCLFAGVAGGALGAFVMQDASEAPARTDAALVPDARPAGEAADQTARAEIDALHMELANLRAEIDGLRMAQARESVTPETDEVAASEGEAPKELSDISDADKEYVFALIEQEREARRQEQRVEREQRMNDWTLERATQIANELGLPAGSEKRMGEIFLERNARMNAMRDELNEMGWGPETRTLMREQAEEINTWRTNALTDAFGAEVAEQIEELNGDRRGGPRGDGEGGGRNGGGFRGR